jgi:hypothetical protein
MSVGRTGSVTLVIRPVSLEMNAGEVVLVWDVPELIGRECEEWLI